MESQSKNAKSKELQFNFTHAFLIAVQWSVFGLLVGLMWTHPAYGQMSPEEHASHHPDQAAGSAPAADSSAGPQANSGTGMSEGGTGASGDMGAGGGEGASGGEGGGSGGGGMGDMMKDMGKAPPLEAYPTLMNLTEQTPEQRTETLQKADERMRAAVTLLSTGMDRLATAVGTDDYAAMQDATTKMHAALAEFESGVATQRALKEGQPPNQVALQWFKSEMSLQPPQGIQVSSGVWGASPFHLFSMVLLIVFALAMVVLYFAKMRRAAALFSRIESNKGAPPPGAAPALAGTPPPSTAPADKPAADAKGS
ncbi:hypothetical protein [Botrimarina mediterranea]|uniref:hypothetical protein n=1 Tax=Botrimarina mediterranea TaxID=2528022 RepID=UPI0011A0821D